MEISGTDGSSGIASKDKLLQFELGKLQLEKAQIKNGVNDYLSSHPEFFKYLDEFVSAVLDNQPNNILSFGVDFFSKLDSLRNQAHTISDPLVIAGPSGVGKGTLVSQLMTRYPKHFGFSVSHTTRQPRPGEEDGIHYHFVEKSILQEAIANGEFIEYANVHTNIYGTSYAAVQKVQSDGKICILDIDIQGVQNVKQSTLQSKYIFISPPSMEILEERLRGRGTETEEKVRVRLANAKAEMDFGTSPGNFDAIIVNDNLELAVDELMDKISSWYPDRDFSS